MGNSRMPHYGPNGAAQELTGVELRMRKAEARFSDYFRKLLGVVYRLPRLREGSPTWLEERREAKILRGAVRRSFEEIRRAEWRTAQRKQLQALRAEIERDQLSGDQVIEPIDRRVEQIDLWDRPRSVDW